MGYMKIPNLYKDTRVLEFKEVFALEKIHGTSAYIRIKNGHVTYHAGGADHKDFVALFDEEVLLASGLDDVTLYGEACGGKIQKMKHTYGDALRFIAFEARIGDAWLSVPQAQDVAYQLHQDFVAWRKVPATVIALDAERDRPSSLALELGLGEQMREGIVIRPPFEVRLNDGSRVIAKHKRAEFAEIASPRKVSQDQLKVLEDAQAIALEWATAMRLTHVIDKMDPPPEGMSDTGRVIKAMVEDVLAEATGEIVESKAARKAIGQQAAKLWKARVAEVKE